MKLNLRTKLIGSFAIILFLMIVVGLTGVYNSKYIENHLKNNIEQNVKPATISGVMVRRIGFIRVNSLLHLFTRSAEDMKRYEAEIADWESKISLDLDTLMKTFKNQTTMDKLEEFRTAWKTYLKIWNKQVLSLSRMNRDKEAFALVKKRGVAGMAAHEAMYKLNELQDAIITIANNSLKLSEQVVKKTQNILLAVILFTIVLGLAFGIRQSSVIANAVNTVSKTARLVAAGDFDQRVTVKTGDEIESMAGSFNTMTDNMKKMVQDLQYEIIERKLAEEKLVRKEKLAVLGQLAGGLGHELRNPLGVMSNAVFYLNTILPEADKTVREYLEIISSEIRKSDMIVSDLLNLTRIRPAEREETGGSGLVSKALEKQPLEKVKVITEIPQDLPHMFVDARQIGQVLDNLITNACQAMPEGGRLTISAQEENKKVSLSITDTGCGISNKNMKHLFEPLFTTKARGIGLGLAMSRNLVEINGGTIEVESKEGRGSTFTVILPIKEAVS